MCIDFPLFLHPWHTWRHVELVFPSNKLFIFFLPSRRLRNGYYCCCLQRERHPRGDSPSCAASDGFAVNGALVFTCARWLEISTGQEYDTGCKQFLTIFTRCLPVCCSDEGGNRVLYNIARSQLYPPTITPLLIDRKRLVEYWKDRVRCNYSPPYCGGDTCGVGAGRTHTGK